MRKFGYAALAFAVGLVLGYVAVVGGAFAYIDYAGIFDRDGGLSMGIVFIIGPLVASVIGFLAALVTIFFMGSPPHMAAKAMAPADSSASS